MAWKGAGDDHAMAWSTFDGSSWSGPHAIDHVGTSNGPALAPLGDQLVMTWKGQTGDAGIYWSTL
jgi:hypothetical protein